MVKAYPKYQNAKLPWLEEMPDGWQIKRAKSVFKCIDIRSESGEEELLTVSSNDGVVPRSQKTVTMFMAESYAGYKLCWPGDLVINSLWAWMFGLGFSRHHGIVSSAYGVYRPLAEYVRYWKYFDYLFRSKVYDWELRVRSRGIWTSRLQLTDDRFLDMPVVIPPIEEAEKIVNFISALDSQIRLHIRKKQRVIKLLNEQKEEIINRAITKGINGSARFKSSGVDWIGDVPSHWDVLKGFQLIYEKQEKNIGLKENQVLSLSYGKIVIKPMEKLHGLVPASFETYQIVDSGDIIIRPTDLQNDKVSLRVGLVRDRGIITSAYLCLKTRENIIPEYVYYLLHSYDIKKVFYGLGSGLRQNLGFIDFKRLPMLLPPKNEQAEIVKYISEKTAGLKDALDCFNKEIQLLKEYRTKIISDLVTGKIDVRDVRLTEMGTEVAPEPIDEQEMSEDIEDSEEVVDADE